MTVSLSITWRKEALNFVNTETSASPPKSPQNNQTSSQFLVYLLLSAPVSPQNKPLSQLQNHHGPLPRLTLRFLSFLCSALFPIFNKTYEGEFLIMGVRRLEDTFSIVQYVPICALGLVCRVCGHRKSVRKDVSRDDVHRQVTVINWAVAYRGGGGFGVFKSPPKFRRPSKIVPNSPRLWKLLKIPQFRTPTPQDVRKKGSKILKLPRFAIVLH